MISPESRVQIRRYFFAEHWKIGTIAQALNVHPDTVRRAIEVERFQHAEPLRPSIVDPYLPFVRETLAQHPRLRATRIYQMIRDRGYFGSVEQLRRTVARLRPQSHEAFLRLQVFPAEQAPSGLGLLRLRHGRSRQAPALLLRHDLVLVAGSTQRRRTRANGHTFTTSQGS